MNCRFDYIDNNVKNKSYADKLTNLVLDTWRTLINSNLFTRKDSSLLFSKENTINRGRQEELISTLNSNHSAPIIFNKENKVVVDVTGLIDMTNNTKFENTDLFSSFVNSIYDNYEKTGIIQQYTNDLFSTKEIVVDKDYEAIKNLFEENPELANQIYELLGFEVANLPITSVQKHQAIQIYIKYLNSVSNNNPTSITEYISNNTPDKLRLVDTIQVTNDTYMIVEKDNEILPQIETYTNYKLLGNKYDDYLIKSNLYNSYLAYLDDKDNYTPTLILPIGISGSGKSTWINNLINKDYYTIISPDEIRKELTGSISDQSKNIDVFRITDELMYDSLRQEKPTIIDATNLNTMFRRKLISEVLNKYPNTKIYYKFMTSNPIISKQRITKDIANNKDRANVPFDIIDRQYDQYLQSLKDVKEEQLYNYDTIVHSYKQLEEMLALDNVHTDLLFNSIPKSTTNVYDYSTREQLTQFKSMYDNLDSIGTKMKWLEYINYKPTELLVKDVPYLFKAFPNQGEERVNKVLNDVYNEQQYLLYINSLKQELRDNFDDYSPILNRIGIYTFDDLDNYDNNTLLKDLCQ